MQSVEGRIKSHMTKMSGDTNKHTTLKIDDMASAAVEHGQKHHAFLLHKF